MSRQLVTCPVCQTDQHVYKRRICNHDGIGAIRCTGSKTLVAELGTPKPVHVAPTTIRESLLAMGYSERKSGHWIKPIAFQAFSYHEGKNEWVCWFRSATGDIEVWESKSLQSDTRRCGSYLRQLKELECWTRTDVYASTDSQFELAAFDL